MSRMTNMTKKFSKSFSPSHVSLALVTAAFYGHPAKRKLFS